MLISKISSKGQTTIPQGVRKAMKLDAGDHLLYEIKEDAVVIRPMGGDIFDHIGSVKPRESPEDFKTVREQVKSSVAERAEH